MTPIAPTRKSTVNPPLRVRLVFDTAAAALLLAGLAYYWLGNVAHEVIGSAMFALMFLHNAFNRRRYGGLARARHEPRGIVDIVVVLALIGTMLVLLVTSLTISNAVFSGLGLNGGFTAKQVHTLAAYWALVIVSIHLGLRWPTIMGAVRNLCGIARASRVRTITLRAIAFVIAVQGVRSSFALAMGSRMSMQVTLDWWDFEASVAGFFFHCIAVAGLYVVTTYCVTRWLAWPRRAATGGLRSIEAAVSRVPEQGPAIPWSDNSSASDELRAIPERVLA